MDKITIPYYKWQVVLEEAGESIPVEIGEEMFCKVIELENQISHLYEHIAKLVQMLELHEKNGDVLMQDIAKLEGSEGLVNVPLGLFLDCVYLLHGTEENYRVPVELIKTMRMALYKMGDYNSEAKAGELYKFLELEEKSDGSNL